MNHDPQTHHQGSPRGGAAAGFTLVEMLTVLAIISILVIIGLPGFRGMNSTGVRRAAVSKMMGVFDQARTIAITEGHNTYVVFSSPSQNGEHADPDPSRWGRGCLIYVEDGNFALQQRSGWIYLPAGVSFKVESTGPDGSDELSLINRFKAQDSPWPTDAPSGFPMTFGDNTTVTHSPYIRFDNTGAIDVQDPRYSRLLIFQGLVNGSGKEVALKKTADSEAQKNLLDEVRINLATGRAKYITDATENLKLQPTPSPTPTSTPAS